MSVNTCENLTSTFYSAYVKGDVTRLLRKLEKEEYEVGDPGEILSEMKHLGVHISDRTVYNISFKLPSFIADD